MAVQVKREAPALKTDPKRKRVSMDDDLELDTAKLSTKVWLVKIPHSLAERWSSLTEDGLDLGKVEIPGDNLEQATLTLSNVGQPDELPKEYNLKILEKEPKNLYVFREDENGCASMQGTVVAECGVTPVYNEEYRRLAVKRKGVAETKRTTMMLSTSEAKPNIIGPGSRTLDVFVPEKLTKQQTLDNRTSRMPRNELEDLIFAGFEKYQYWTFKSVQKYTNQPAAYIKEVLSDMCILHKRGEHNAHYELQPQFKIKHQPATSAIAPAATEEAPDSKEAAEEDDKEESDLEDDDFEEVE